MDAWKNKLIGKALAEFSVPAGLFGEGAYEARYAIRAIRPNAVKFAPEKAKVKNEGSLNLTVLPSGRENKLRIEHVNMPLPPQESELISAEIHCAGNELFSPLHWSFSQRFIKNRNDREKLTGLSETGCMKNGTLWRNNRQTTSHAGKKQTNDYALFAALPVLHQRQMKEIRFDMFESFSAFRPNQRIVYAGLLDVPFKNGTVAIHEYQHYGTGILPWHHWVGEGGLLVCSIRGHYLFMLEKFGRVS